MFKKKNLTGKLLDLKTNKETEIKITMHEVIKNYTHIGNGQFENNETKDIISFGEDCWNNEAYLYEEDIF